MRKPRIGNWILVILLTPVFIWGIYIQFFVPHPKVDWLLNSYLVQSEDGMMTMPMLTQMSEPTEMADITAFEEAAYYMVPARKPTGAELRLDELDRAIAIREQRLQNLNFEIASRNEYKRLLDDHLRSLKAENIKLANINNDNLIALLEITERNAARNIVVGAFLGAFIGFILSTSHVKERLERFLFETPELKRRL